MTKLEALRQRRSLLMLFEGIRRLERGEDLPNDPRDLLSISDKGRNPRPQEPIALASGDATKPQPGSQCGRGRPGSGHKR